MENPENAFNLSSEQLNRLFPFYIIINQSLCVEAVGPSIRKICKGELGQPFGRNFKISRPTIPINAFEDLKLLEGQMILFEAEAISGGVLSFRGWFEPLMGSNKYVVLGSPWLGSMGEVRKHNLTLNDFSPYDSMIDLLRAFQTQEISTESIKQLLNTVNQQKEDLKKDKQQLEHLSLVAKANNNGVLFTNKEGKINWVNSGFLTLTGYEESEVLDQFIEKLAKGPLTEEEKISTILFAFQKEEFRWTELQFYKKDGSWFWAKLSVQPIVDEHANLKEFYLIVEDISSDKHYKDELKIAKKIAEEASNAKENFLATMSHEIRTPLNAIMGMLRAMGKSRLNLEQSKALENAHIASKHLLSIINNILDMSKIEAGEFFLDKSPFALHKVILEAMDILSTTAADKQLQFQSSISPSVSGAYIGDAARIRQILINVLGNALKFTSQGGVFVSIDAKPAAEGMEEVLLEIRDTGVGMEESFLANLFEKFSQENQVEQNLGGTGLGMAITQQLVQLMEGRIELESEKGVGTLVRILLPLVINKGAVSELESNKRTHSSISNLHVLLVEDNAMNILVATNALDGFGMRYTVAERAKEAIEKLKSNSYDIVLMDIQMPEMDGIEATQIIRNELKLSLPIIALTANVFKKEIDQCLAVGMNDYVIKPFDEDVLLETILKYCSEKVEAALSNKVTKVYNLDELKQMSRGDSAFIERMVKLFAELVPQSLLKIQNALVEKNYAQIKSIAHSIRPSVEKMGIRSCADNLRQIERMISEQVDEVELSKLIDLVQAELEQAILQLEKEYG